MDVIFLRHPVTDAPEGLCYGRLDVGLGAEAGTQIDRALAETPHATALVASPLSRCRLLTERLAARDAITPRYDPRLVEHDFGNWEGRMWSDLPRAETEAWIADIQTATVPGGEAFTDLIARVRAALDEIPAGALVVCHAGVIRAARMILTGASFEQVFAEEIPFAAPIRLVREAA